jgi:hypothetical protein
VIDVGMREHYGVHPFGIIQKIPIPFHRFSPPALVEPTVEKDLRSIHLDEMLRSGGSSGCAAEAYLH